MRVLVTLITLALIGAPVFACDQGVAAAPSVSLAGAETPERAVEREMLRLTNQARTQAGESPLTFDEALARAARAHAREMLRRGELSHQFAGEPNLSRRLAQSDLHFDQAAENVAQNSSAAKVHESFMASPGHRENVLDPAYDAVGIGVVRDGCKLYVVEDFAHRVRNYADAEAEDRVAEQVSSLRSAIRLPRLQRQTNPKLSRVACSMVQSGRLDVVGAGAAKYVLNYTNAEPEVLPTSAERVIADQQMRNFSVGACYGRNEKHPSGAYFVTMVFY